MVPEPIPEQTPEPLRSLQAHLEEEAKRVFLINAHNLPNQTLQEIRKALQSQVGHSHVSIVPEGTSLETVQAQISSRDTVAVIENPDRPTLDFQKILTLEKANHLKATALAEIALSLTHDKSVPPHERSGNTPFYRRFQKTRSREKRQ